MMERKMSKNKGRSSHQKRALKRRLFGGRESRPCCFCRRVLTFALATLEHVIPLSKNGGWNLENIRLSCGVCNHERAAEDFDEFRKKKRAVDGTGTARA